MLKSLHRYLQASVDVDMLSLTLTGLCRQAIRPQRGNFHSEHGVTVCTYGVIVYLCQSVCIYSVTVCIYIVSVYLQYHRVYLRCTMCTYAVQCVLTASKCVCRGPGVRDGQHPEGLYRPQHDVTPHQAQYLCTLLISGRQAPFTVS